MINYNKVIGKSFAVLLIFALAFTLLPFQTYGAVQTTAELEAEALHSLDLLHGNDNGYELHRSPTKIETLFMLVNFMGYSDHVQQENTHPFTDIPAWADGQVSYAYQHGYIEGISKDEFGSNQPSTRVEFLTFLLKVMGYREGIDFSSDAAVYLAGDLGLLNSNAEGSLFTRADMVHITWNALKVNVKSQQPKTLASLLVDRGVFTWDSYEKANTIVTSEPKKVKTVYLTFDDGPGTKVTPRILETLKSEGIPATFFVLGSSVDKNPEMLRKVYRDGHRIGNHSYGHDYKLLYEKPENLTAEIEKTNSSINKALGFDYQNKIFRFPGGASIRDQKFKDAVHNMGYEYYGWNCSGEDSVSAKGATAEEILNNVKVTAKNRDEVTVLLHDNDAKSTTADALPSIIKYFKDNGYVFRAI